MTNRKLFLLMVAMPFLTALTLGVGAAWLSGDVRMFGLVGLAAAIVGGAGAPDGISHLPRAVPDACTYVRHAPVHGLLECQARVS